MKPKEKAKDLIDKFTFQRDEHEMYVAKQCALIAVDEIIDECRVGMDWFWQEVKQEIELL